MILSELETGLYLDLDLQKFLQKYYSINIEQMLVIDELHSPESLMSLNQTFLTNNPFTVKTITIDPSSLIYRISFTIHNGMEYCKIEKQDSIDFMFVIMNKDFKKWQQEISSVQKNYYI
jgi:hypothetical protein